MQGGRLIANGHRGSSWVPPIVYEHMRLPAAADAPQYTSTEQPAGLVGSCWREWLPARALAALGGLVTMCAKQRAKGFSNRKKPIQGKRAVTLKQCREEVQRTAEIGIEPSSFRGQQRREFLAKVFPQVEKDFAASITREPRDVQRKYGAALMRASWNHVLDYWIDTVLKRRWRPMPASADSECKGPSYLQKCVPETTWLEMGSAHRLCHIIADTRCNAASPQEASERMHRLMHDVVANAHNHLLAAAVVSMLAEEGIARLKDAVSKYHFPTLRTLSQVTETNFLQWRRLRHPHGLASYGIDLHLWGNDVPWTLTTSLMHTHPQSVFVQCFLSCVALAQSQQCGKAEGLIVIVPPEREYHLGTASIQADPQVGPASPSVDCSSSIIGSTDVDLLLQFTPEPGGIVVVVEDSPPAHNTENAWQVPELIRNLEWHESVTVLVLRFRGVLLPDPTRIPSVDLVHKCLDEVLGVPSDDHEHDEAFLEMLEGGKQEFEDWCCEELALLVKHNNDAGRLTKLLMSEVMPKFVDAYWCQWEELASKAECSILSNMVGVNELKDQIAEVKKMISSHQFSLTEWQKTEAKMEGHFCDVRQNYGPEAEGSIRETHAEILEEARRLADDEVAAQEQKLEEQRRRLDQTLLSAMDSPASSLESAMAAIDKALEDCEGHRMDLRASYRATLQCKAAIKAVMQLREACKLEEFDAELQRLHEAEENLEPSAAGSWPQLEVKLESADVSSELAIAEKQLGELWKAQGGLTATLELLQATVQELQTEAERVRSDVAFLDELGNERWNAGCPNVSNITEQEIERLQECAASASSKAKKAVEVRWRVTLAAAKLAELKQAFEARQLCRVASILPQARNLGLEGLDQKPFEAFEGMEEEIEVWKGYLKTAAEEGSLDKFEEALQEVEQVVSDLPEEYIQVLANKVQKAEKDIHLKAEHDLRLALRPSLPRELPRAEQLKKRIDLLQTAVDGCPSTGIDKDLSTLRHAAALHLKSLREASRVLRLMRDLQCQHGKGDLLALKEAVEDSKQKRSRFRRLPWCADEDDLSGDRLVSEVNSEAAKAVKDLKC